MENTEPFGEIKIAEVDIIHKEMSVVCAIRGFL